MTDKSIVIDKKRDFDDKGHFAKGNKIGRMPKKGFTLNDITKLVRKYERVHDKTILKHYVEELFNDNKMLDRFIDRYVPTKTISELTGADGSPLTFIVEKSYKEPKEEKTEKKDEG